MGNRATIIFANEDWTEASPAVYLHWNGGPESVYAFLAELDRRDQGHGLDYVCARFAQLVGEFFDGDKQYSTLSLGVVTGPSEITSAELEAVQTDHGDNGFYVVSRQRTGDGQYITTVRRWLERHTRYQSMPDSWHLEEQSPEWVQREREQADKTYAESMRQAFGELAHGRKPDCALTATADAVEDTQDMGMITGGTE